MKLFVFIVLLIVKFSSQLDAQWGDLCSGDGDTCADGLECLGTTPESTSKYCICKNSQIKVTDTDTTTTGTTTTTTGPDDATNGQSRRGVSTEVDVCGPCSDNEDCGAQAECASDDDKYCRCMEGTVYDFTEAIKGNGFSCKDPEKDGDCEKGNGGKFDENTNKCVCGSGTMTWKKETREYECATSSATDTVSTTSTTSTIVVKVQQVQGDDDKKNDTSTKAAAAVPLPSIIAAGLPVVLAKYF